MASNLARARESAVRGYQSVVKELTATDGTYFLAPTAFLGFLVSVWVHTILNKHTDRLEVCTYVKYILVGLEIFFAIMLLLGIFWSYHRYKNQVGAKAAAAGAAAAQAGVATAALVRAGSESD